MQGMNGMGRMNGGGMGMGGGMSMPMNMSMNGGGMGMRGGGGGGMGGMGLGSGMDGTHPSIPLRTGRRSPDRDDRSRSRRSYSRWPLFLLNTSVQLVCFAWYYHTYQSL